MSAGSWWSFRTGRRASCGGKVLLAITASALLATSCADAAAATVALDGSLVLELGGGQPSLAGVLQRYGARLAPPRDFRAVRLPGEPPVPVAPDAGPAPDPANQEVPNPATNPATNPVERAPAEADAVNDAAEPWFEVPLPKGKSLIHLAKQYLGDANRFRELLQLNGWTEKDARMLREGTKVKIPREPKK